MEKSTFKVAPTCLDCRFSDTKIAATVSVRVCRLSPPLAAHAFVPEKGGMQMLVQSLWPQLDGGDWCGKLEPRAAAAN